MGEVRASLYDIFGYLIPGMVALAALRLFSWVLFYPSTVLSLELFEKPFWIFVLALISYVLGHLTHAIGNWFNATKSTEYSKAVLDEAGKSKFAKLFERPRVSAQMIALSDAELEKRFGQEISNLSYSDRMTMMDEFRIVATKENEREVYIYREGFYRGMFVSTVLLILALIASLFVGNLALSYSKLQLFLQWNERLFYLILTIVSAVGFWLRMVRFSHYRMNRAAAHFLIISKTKTKNNG